MSAHSVWADNLKKVWGGGPPHASAYSGVYVPILIEQLSNQRLSGYQWGGLSAGTLQNVKTVHENPTHLALAQRDLLETLKAEYKFTVIKDDIGPECLYMVTKNIAYSNWGTRGQQCLGSNPGDRRGTVWLLGHLAAPSIGLPGP